MKENFNFQTILNLCNYIFLFFLLNLFFLFFNLPIIIFFIFIGMQNITNYLPLFLITLIPVMPTFTVLIYCMNRLIRNKDLMLLKDFFHGIKINYIQSLLIWCCELITIFILYSNISFFSKYSKIIVFPFLILSIILFLITPYLYILTSKFSMTTFNIIKSSIILALTRPFLTLTNTCIIIIPLILFEIMPGTTVLFIAIIPAFLLSLCNNALVN